MTHASHWIMAAVLLVGCGVPEEAGSTGGEILPTRAQVATPTTVKLGVEKQAPKACPLPPEPCDPPSPPPSPSPPPAPGPTCLVIDPTGKEAPKACPLPDFP